ncbi:unnamed protein product, partial [Durusdinium trenchii]
DLGTEDAFVEVQDGQVQCFPYEHAPIFKQELIHVFGAEVFVDLSPEPLG